MASTPDDPPPSPSSRYDVASSAWVRAPRQARSEETMVRFLDATTALLRERDFEDISVNDIAERAGRTVGSFYGRFDDKRSVLRVLVADVAAQMRATAFDFWSAEAFADASIDEIITRSVDAVLDAYSQAGSVFHAAASQARNDPGFREPRLEVWVVCAERFGVVIAGRAHEITHPDPARAGQLSLMAVISMLDVRMIYGLDVPPLYADRAQLRTDLIDVVTRILGPRT